MQLHWRRQDLRITDNRGLVTAVEADLVTPLFAFDRNMPDHAGAPRVRYLLDALAKLRGAYQKRRSNLLVTRSDPRTVVPAVAAAFGAKRAVWGIDYSGLARERDVDMRFALDGAGVARGPVYNATFHPSGSITTNAGNTYPVYTYFQKK